MRYLVSGLVICSFCVALAACGGNKPPPKPAMSQADAKAEVVQLIELYKADRIKFERQKGVMIKEEGCGRVIALKKAIDKMKQDADMSAKPSKDIDFVHMNITEAHKKCLAK